MLTCKPASRKWARGMLNSICSALMVKTAVVSTRIELTTHIWLIQYRWQFDDCISCIFLETHALCFLINENNFSPLFYGARLFVSVDYTHSTLFLTRFSLARDEIQSFYWVQEREREIKKRWKKSKPTVWKRRTISNA